MDIGDHIKPIGEISPEYNFLMGYTTGAQREWWHGIEGVTSIFMGAWSDPYIGYKGHAFNALLVEDYFWDRYEAEQPAPDYLSQEYLEYSTDGFDRFMRENSEEVFECLDGLLEDYLRSRDGPVLD